MPERPDLAQTGPRRAALPSLSGWSIASLVFFVLSLPFALFGLWIRPTSTIDDPAAGAVLGLGLFVSLGGTFVLALLGVIFGGAGAFRSRNRAAAWVFLVLNGVLCVLVIVVPVYFLYAE